MNCAEWSYEGNIPSILFRVVPDALHPTAESTAVTVRWRDPAGDELGVITSPDSHLVHTTNIEQVDGVDTLISFWTFTFPDALVPGSRRNPWKVKFSSTAGIATTMVTERTVLPSGY